MSIVAFNGSPRKGGNTSRMIKTLLEVLRKHDLPGEEIQVGGQVVRGCVACGVCSKIKGRCAIDSDDVNLWIEKMVAAEAVILASPTYFANITPEIKALIDRAGMVSLTAGGLLRRKVGAPIAVARRGGAIQVYNALMAFFGITQMIVPMSSYWNMGYGLEPGDVDSDVEAMDTMTNLGENMAFVIKKLSGRA